MRGAPLEPTGQGSKAQPLAVSQALHAAPPARLHAAQARLPLSAHMPKNQYAPAVFRKRILPVCMRVVSFSAVAISFLYNDSMSTSSCVFLSFKAKLSPFTAFLILVRNA